MRILITGGAGFLGKHLIHFLNDHEVIIMDLYDPKTCNFINADITRPDLPGFEGIDIVIHLAGLVSFSLKDRSCLRRVNIEGTSNVCINCRKHGVKRLIHVSSVAALGYCGNPVDENFEFEWSIAERHHKHYMISKHEADKVVEEYRTKGGHANIVYPGLMFGPGDRNNTMKLIESVRKLPFTTPGGTNVIDVRDVARAISMMVEKDCDGDFLLSGYNMSFKEIYDTTAQEIGKKPSRFTLPRLVGLLLYYLILVMEYTSKIPLTADNVHSAFINRYFSNNKAMRQFGWKPDISFKQTISDSIQWIRDAR